jgi:hypothetical protein
MMSQRVARGGPAHRQGTECELRRGGGVSA